MTRSITAAVAAVAVAAVAVAGCARLSPVRTETIRLGSAYILRVGQGNSVDAYLVISNSGPPDRLLRAASSTGGQVVLRGRYRPGTPSGPLLSDLRVPGHGMIRLDPNGVHLVIMHPGPIRQGSVITLTLVFARAGTVRVVAQVTDLRVNSGTASGAGGP